MLQRPHCARHAPHAAHARPDAAPACPPCQCNTACLFLIATVLAIPSMTFLSSASGLAVNERGPLSLGTWTLANMGHVKDPNMNQTGCVQGIGCEGSSEARIAYLGTALWSESEQSNLITACDVACSLVFMAFIWYMRRALSKAAETERLLSITPSQYTVWVRGLPADVTREQVWQHFDQLYNPLSEDWVHHPLCGRAYQRPVMQEESEESVARASYMIAATMRGHRSFARATATRTGATPFSDHEMFVDSSIADVQLARPNGAIINNFKDLAKLTKQLNLAKAQLRKLRWRNAKASKIEKAEASLAAAEARLMMQQSKAVAKKSDVCLGAFVTFNNEVSHTRCLEDYKEAHRFCGLRAAKPLRFDGKHLLSVTRAPDPSNIMWENLEISSCNRAQRICLSTLIMVLMLSISFAVALVAQAGQSRVSKLLPADGVCSEHYPAKLWGQQSYVPPSLQLELVPGDTCDTRAAELGWASGTYLNLEYIGFSAQLTESGSLAQPRYNASDLCMGNCFRVDNTETICPTLDAEVTYFPATVAQCFCKDELVRILASGQILNAVDSIQASSGDSCVQVAQLYITSQALIIGGTAVVVVMNLVLRLVLTRSTVFERHSTVGSYMRAVSIKVFIAQFLNTGVIVLLANAQFDGLREAGLGFLADSGILAGKFSSFQAGWYSMVGVSIALTQIIDIAAPHVMSLAGLCCLNQRKIKSAISNAVHQNDLMERLRTPVLDLEVKLASLLKNVMIAMTYSAGLPMLLPIAGVSATVTYLIQKTQLLRYFSKPPAVDVSIIGAAVETYSWALIFHLGVGMWMYSQLDVMASQSVFRSLLDRGWLSVPASVDTTGMDSTQVMEGAEEVWNRYFLDKTSSYDAIGLVPRLLRTNTLPLFIVLVLAVAVNTIENLGIAAMVQKSCKPLLRAMCCGRCVGRKARADYLKPPYTGRFIQPVFAVQQKHISLAEERAGWLVVPDPYRGEEFQARARLWPDTGTFLQRRHQEGEFMLTYEAVSHWQLHSYAMSSNPQYRLVAMALELNADELHKLIAERVKQVSGKSEKLARRFTHSSTLLQRLGFTTMRSTASVVPASTTELAGEDSSPDASTAPAPDAPAEQPTASAAPASEATESDQPSTTQ